MIKNSHKTILTESSHPHFTRLVAQNIGRSSVGYHIAQFLIYHHQFSKSFTSFITGMVTNLASFAVTELLTGDLPAFKPEALVSFSLVQGDKTVTLSRGVEDGKAVWARSVNGEAPVTMASDLASSLELLVGDMDYLVCYSVKEADLAAYGLDADTVAMTVVYTKTVSSVTEELTFKLTLGGTDKYGYYYANPEGTTLTMLLGGSVFSKVMTYDDAHLAEGDLAASDTDTASDTAGN